MIILRTQSNFNWESQEFASVEEAVQAISNVQVTKKILHEQVSGPQKYIAVR